MVLTNQFAIGALDPGGIGLRRYAERCIRIGEPVLWRFAAGRRRAAGSGTQQRLELRHICFTETQPLRNTHEHCVLGGIDTPVCGNRHALQLQEQLQQWTTTAADASELVDCGIEIEIGLLTAVEGGFSAFPILAVQVKHPEDLLDGFDLVAGNDLVGLAERAHDGKGRIEQLRLRHAKSADNRLLQYETGGVADDATDEGARDTAGKCADDGADNH